jgi:hypothetical protein
MIQFQFFAEAEPWIESICNKESAAVKVMSLKSDNSDKYVTQFVDISSEITNAEDLARELNSDSRIRKSDLAKIGPRRLVGEVTSKGSEASVALMEIHGGCFIAPAKISRNHRMNYKLFVSDGGLPNLLEKLHKRRIGYQISNVSLASNDSKTSSEEERLIRSALKLSYDERNRIRNYELAERMRTETGDLSDTAEAIDTINHSMMKRLRFPYLDVLVRECVFCSTMKEIEETDGLNEADDTLFHQHLYLAHLRVGTKEQNDPVG